MKTMSFKKTVLALALALATSGFLGAPVAQASTYFDGFMQAYYAAMNGTEARTFIENTIRDLDNAIKNQKT